MSTTDPGVPGKYPAGWPWHEMNALADQISGQITEGTAQIMRKAGEDPGNQQLFDLRCRQFAYSIWLQASRLWQAPPDQEART
jgi:hypothetical protein